MKTIKGAMMMAMENEDDETDGEYKMDEGSDIEHLKAHVQVCGGETIPRPFSENQN